MHRSLQIFTLGVALGMVRCGSDESGNNSRENDESGGSSTGGNAGSGTGGSTSGGQGGSGGASSGGAAATGGMAATGGSGGSGGGGSSGKGGTATGGSSGSATGGKGGAGTGGKGGTATGGSSGSAAGGTGGMVVIPDTCTEADRTLTQNATGRHCGYTYEYWKDSGSGSLVLRSDGFSVDWSNINNLLGRKGIRPGSANLVATYDADYQPNGNSYLCIYGWTRNPLVEYYIVDSWGSGRPPGGMSMGTVQSDGGTYDIYRTQRVNAPSIDGNQTFYQYWSVRTTKRTSGVITVGNHFTAWAGEGMNLGSFYEVSMTVEGYQSNGTATVRMMIE